VISRHFLRCALPAALGLAVVALATPGARAEDTILAMPGQNVLFLSRYIADDQHLWSKQGLNVKIHRVRSLTTIEFIVVSMPMTAWGLPHSDIAGS
jgi:ABC-type nitrate/sulfonate/bicarbonate transport system substrate-binding protein